MHVTHETWYLQLKPDNTWHIKPVTETTQKGDGPINQPVLNPDLPHPVVLLDYA